MPRSTSAASAKTPTVSTFGDVRRIVLDTIVGLRDGSMEISRGMAIAANVKVLNDNIQAEIAATKLAIATENKLHSFGQVVHMGRRLIAETLPESPGEA